MPSGGLLPELAGNSISWRFGLPAPTFAAVRSATLLNAERWITHAAQRGGDFLVATALSGQCGGAVERGRLSLRAWAKCWFGSLMMGSFGFGSYA